MPYTKICYDKWIDGKPYPMSYTYCEVCGARYPDPTDAVNCEKASYEPKFKTGEKVGLRYESDEYPAEGIVLEVIPSPPRKGSDKHTVKYKVIFIGTTEDIFFERELRLLV